MMKIIVLLVAFVAFSSAKPALVATVPAVATAYSSQYYDRFSSGLTAAYLAAPATYVASAAAPYVVAPYATAPYISAPYIAASAPLVAI